MDNLIIPGSIIPYPNYVPTAPMPVLAPIVPMVPTPPIIFGVKSQKRLQVACDRVCFYETFGQPLTASNVQWNTQMNNFSEKWKSLTTQKDEGALETLKISKDLPFIKWVEMFRDHLNGCLIVRKILLSYLTCPDVGVAGAVPLQ